MAIDLYKTRTMLRALETMYPARSFLLDTFFGTVEQSETEYVDIDIYVGKRRMAPFVNPMSEGKLVEGQGFTTQTIKPPYLKPKDKLDTSMLTDRPIGNTIYQTGSTPQSREAAKLGRKLAELRDMVTRRMEWMAANALNTGIITVVGDGFNATIDFAMPAANKVTLTGTALWTDAASDPITNLRNWRRQISQKTGLVPDVAVFGADVVDAFLKNDEVRALMDNRRMEPGAINFANLNEMGVTYVGNIQGLSIYAYDEWYLDTDGNEYPMVPVDKIFMGSTKARTARHFGLIQDLEAPGAVPFYPKSWTVPDPSVRWVMVQSAPLVALHESGAFMSIKAV